MNIIRAIFFYITLREKCSNTEFFSGPYFPSFGQNTERYGISHRIQSECGKIRTKKLRIWTLFTQCQDTFFDFQKRSGNTSPLPPLIAPLPQYIIHLLIQLMTTLNVFSSSFHFVVSSLKLGFVLNVIRLGVDKTIKHTFNILLQDSQRICDHFITSTNILSQTLWKFCRKAQFPHSFGRIASFG